jgi:hydrogenase small subunit
MDIVKKMMKKDDFLLVVEGSMPVTMPEACMMGHEPITDLVLKTASRAKAVVAAGTCASFGGIPAAENNPTGALSVPDFLNRENISKPVIRLPGCPTHPDWIVGTLAHLLKFGMPPLDDKGRPRMFYSKLIHDQCPRFPEYERENFAKSFSDDGCLFKLGCLGVNTFADCTIRYWNSKINSCIPAGGPCIGCASENFALKTSFPFYRKGEKSINKET